MESPLKQHPEPLWPAIPALFVVGGGFHFLCILALSKGSMGLNKGHGPHRQVQIYLQVGDGKCREVRIENPEAAK